MDNKALIIAVDDSKVSPAQAQLYSDFDGIGFSESFKSQRVGSFRIGVSQSCRLCAGALHKR